MTKKKLIYVTPDNTWIRRRKQGSRYQYLDAGGHVIQKESFREYWNSLAIPPAYRDVLICPQKNGHIQAVGRDQRNRRQYIYHKDWIALQAAQKFDRVVAFGRALPHLRRTVQRHLRQKAFTKEKVLAAMVKIMDETNVRVGNPEYAKTHQTFGLTTLRRRHIQVRGFQVLFQFKGKNNTPWEVTLKNTTVSNVIKKCAEIPGHHLFKYADEKGEIHTLCSEDFNTYLQTIMLNDFTAKDFRTWAASRDLFWALVHTPGDTPTDRKAHLTEIIKTVAQKMGHTVAICKSSYVYPPLIEAYLTGELNRWAQRKIKKNPEQLLLKWWR